MMAEPAPTRILLVDDDPRNLDALESVLEAPDRELLRAGSGEEALREMLRVGEVALVVLDVNMPELDGLATAALIRGRAQSSHTPIIFLTASGDTYQEQGYQLGAVDYLPKPFLPAALQAKVAVFVELFRRTQEAHRLAEEQARRARLEGALLAARTMEHELGNQLAAASGFLQLMLRRAELEGEMRRFASTALSRLDAAAGTLHQLQDLIDLPQTDWGIPGGSTIDLAAPPPAPASVE